METKSAKFFVGQLVHHNQFNYRGVIVGVDPCFENTEKWYEKMAISRPPKDQPWYHVLVHEALHTTYVAERNLEADSETTPIIHPLVEHFFIRFENGRYVFPMS